MANTKATLLLAIFCIVLVHELEFFSGRQWAVEAQNIDCKAKCEYRCSKAMWPKLCIKTCNTCCARCQCVPPGTEGNTHQCPCYAQMTTHGGKPKCP